MKKKIFLRFFLLSIISALLVFSVGLLAVNLSAKALIRERLEAETGLACALVDDSTDFDKFQIYFNNDEFRVTVIDLDGRVLYESDTKSSLENHADREEFKNAINGKSVAIERYSATFKCKMTYFAQKVTLSNGEQIVIRLAVKNSQVSDYISISLPLLGVVLAVAVALSIVLANIQSKGVTKRIEEVGKSVKSLNEGTYLPINADAGDKELQSVYNEINELSVSLLSHIVNEERERGKLDLVLSNVLQGIIAVDENDKIVFANKSALRLFESVDKPNEELLALINDFGLYQKITENLSKNQNFEYSYKDKTLLVAVKKLIDSSLDQSISNIIILTDVTSEKEMAKQKSDFFANASHELKTPVTVMQGLSEIMLTKDLDEPMQKQVERIYLESLRLSSLISDMLKLSKLERGEISPNESVWVELKKVSEEVLAELSQMLTEKEIEVSISGDGKVFAEEKKIYELIGNLLSNSVNYNKQGGRIEISILSSGERVVFKVEDTGIGIEKEHLPRLCERFYRVDKSRSKKTGGTGLGLAIVKHVCALYGAELNVESEFGVGTKVTVTF